MLIAQCQGLNLWVLKVLFNAFALLFLQIAFEGQKFIQKCKTGYHLEYSVVVLSRDEHSTNRHFNSSYFDYYWSRYRKILQGY